MPGTWSYSAAPWNFGGGSQFVSLSAVGDTVRFLIQDTNINDPQLFDEEILGVMAQNGITSSTLTFVNSANTGPVYMAAIECARAIIGKYTRLANKTVGDLSIQYSAIAQQYRDLIHDITTQAQRHLAAAPYVGGISMADKEIDQDDDDLVQPTFAKGFMDDPGTAPDAGISNSNPFDGFNRLTPG